MKLWVSVESFSEDGVSLDPATVSTLLQNRSLRVSPTRGQKNDNNKLSLVLRDVLIKTRTLRSNGSNPRWTTIIGINI